MPNKLRQTFPANHFYILYASFDVYGMKLGWCHLGMGSQQSENGRGGWWNPIPWFLFCQLLKYLTGYVLQTCYVDENHHFLTYSAKIPAKIPCFYAFFLAKNWFLLIFTYIFNAFKFPTGRWLYDVTVTSYEVQWYSFWYQWIEEVHIYTLVANIGVSGVPYRKSREGGCNKLQQRVTKNTSGGLGLKW